MSKIVDFFRALFAPCTLSFTELTPEVQSQYSQRSKILAHLQSGRCITEQYARTIYGCANLQARIHELRKAGYKIQTEWIGIPYKNGSYVRYWLTEVDE